MKLSINSLIAATSIGSSAAAHIATKTRFSDANDPNDGLPTRELQDLLSMSMNVDEVIASPPSDVVVDPIVTGLIGGLNAAGAQIDLSMAAQAMQAYGFDKAPQSLPEHVECGSTGLTCQCFCLLNAIERTLTGSCCSEPDDLLAGVCLALAIKDPAQESNIIEDTLFALAEKDDFVEDVADSWNYLFCRRALREGELPVQEEVPLDRRLEIIKSMEPLGAKPDAEFSFQYDLITKDSCDALIDHLEMSIANDLAFGTEWPVGSASSDGLEEKYESWLPFEGGISNQYNRKIYADDLVKLIGKNETLKIIDYFDKSLGGVPIDCMYLARHGNPADDELFNVPWHKDDYLTMEITLNDNYDGGHVLHLNADGVHKTFARPGSVTAHKNDIVHGITPNTNGAKYMLILKHHPNRPDKKGVVRLSKEMVYALPSSHL